MVPGTVTTHEIPLTRALHIRERSQCGVVCETEELMEESNIVGLREFLRGAGHAVADGCPRAAHLASHRRGREKERRGFLPPSSSSRCGILSRNTEFSLGKIKQVHVTELTMAMNRMLQGSLPAATRHALSISPGICRMCCPHTENVLSIYNVSSLDRTCSLCSDAQGVEHVARQTHSQKYSLHTPYT